MVKMKFKLQSICFVVFSATGQPQLPNRHPVQSTINAQVDQQAQSTDQSVDQRVVTLDSEPVHSISQSAVQSEESSQSTVIQTDNQPSKGESRMVDWGGGGKPRRQGAEA
jgi:hypothetical protein